MQRKQSHSEHSEISTHLFTTTEVKETREKLLEEQSWKDLITGLVIPDKQAVLDHDHKTQYVRGVLHRQTNVVLGKIENMWTRYLKWWYSGTLSEFLRGCADYLERGPDKRYVHPGWLKTSTSQFKSLNEKEKDTVLSLMASSHGKNAAERIKKFTAALNSRRFTMTQVSDIIQKAKDNK